MSKKAEKTTEQSLQIPIRANINWLNEKEEGNIRATANLTLGGSFVVHGIKVISSEKGDFVSMPSFKSGNNYKDIFHAITADARQQMNDAVMKAYEQKLSDNFTQDSAIDSAMKMK